MAQLQPLSDLLHQLNSNGYTLADAVLSALPEDAVLSNDWRLDSVHRVQLELELGAAAVVIAVSSVERCLKLVFVEPWRSKTDFSPMNVVRRLFPMRRRANFPAPSNA